MSTFVIYDLEWTAWEGSQELGWSRPGEHREIVQFGAVKLDATNGLGEVARFERLVRPKINPVLSDYLIALTGITNEQVAADGVAYPDALAGFLDFAGSDELYAFGRDHVVIAENCTLNDLPSPVDGRFHNLRPVLAAVLGEWILTAQSGGVPERLGLPPTVGRHTAVADAAAVAEVLKYLLRQERLPPLPGRADP